MKMKVKWKALGISVPRGPYGPRRVTIRFQRYYEYTLKVKDMPKPVKRDKLSSFSMGCGKGKPCVVIDDGYVMEYVGIGWVEVRDVATKEDYLRFPRVID